MKRILVACVAALALAAATEQTAMANHGGGFTIGVGVDLTFRAKCWRDCNNSCPGGNCGYGAPGYGGPGYGGWPPYAASAPAYAPPATWAAPAPTPAPAAPKTAPAGQTSTQQIGYYQDYSGAGYDYTQNYGYTGYTGYGYGYAPSYWYGY